MEENLHSILKVHCVATIEDLGFSKKSDQLEIDILGKVFNNPRLYKLVIFNYFRNAKGSLNCWTGNDPPELSFRI